jgi:hypothetical protein
MLLTQEGGQITLVLITSRETQWVSVNNVEFD